MILIVDNNNYNVANESFGILQIRKVNKITADTDVSIFNISEMSKMNIFQINRCVCFKKRKE